MIINEIYTVVVCILKSCGLIDWPWVAILTPEIVWFGVYLFCLVFFAIAIRTAQPFEEDHISHKYNNKDEWRGLD